MGYSIVEVEDFRSGRFVVATYRQQLVAPALSYYLAIDLDNAGGGGPYRHITGLANPGVKLATVSAYAKKSAAGASWELRIGVVRAIDAINSTILFFRPGSLNLASTGIVESRVEASLFPNVLDLTVVAGVATRLASGNTLIDPGLNTGTLIPDVSGINRVVAPGDVILRLERTVGAGTADFDLTLGYAVEAS